MQNTNETQVPALKDSESRKNQSGRRRRVGRTELHPMKRKKGREFFEWILCNVFIPLLPLAFRAFLVFFSEEKVKSLEILNVSEVDYFNLFMCIIIINMFRDCEWPAAYWLSWLFFVFAGINIIFIIMQYYDDAGFYVLGFSVGSALVVIIFAVVFKAVMLWKEGRT